MKIITEATFQMVGGENGLEFAPVSETSYEYDGPVSEGKKGGSAPAPPDPYKTAEAQAQMNAEAIQKSAEVNQINQITPYGSVQWSGTIGEPDRTQTTSLTPEGMGILDKQFTLADILAGVGVDRAGQITGEPFSLSGARTLPGDFSEDAARVEQATFDRTMGLLRPEFERNQAQLEQRLANQGIPVGAEAYADEWDIFNRNRREAELAAAQDAVGAGRAEQSRLFGVTQAGRQQDISDLLLERTQPMNELAALLQGSPALQGQQPSNIAQYQQAPGDYQGSVWNNYNAQLQNYQNRQNASNAMWGNILGAAGTIGGAILSDRRLKQNIVQIGEDPRGFNWYEFEYINGSPRMIGVMAQEVQEVIPEAVVEIDGYLAVDYSRV